MRDNSKTLRGLPRQKKRTVKITSKQLKFCLEYLIDRNATQAYIRAGYSARTAQCAAQSMLSKPHVKAEVNRLIKIQNEEVMVNAEYVLKRLHDIDQLDILDIMDEEMTLFKPLSQWPKTWRISINAIDIKRIVEAGRNGAKDMVTIIEKIKWPDKTRNLELLGKHVSVKAFDGDEAPPEQPISRIVVEVVGANSSD